MPDKNDAIRSYYDGNTRLFLRFGSSSEAQTIHRALWLPGVTALPEALNAANELILAQARPGAAPLKIADLGCGVGATLLYLLEHLPATTRGVGLTLSKLQARLGGRIFSSKQAPGLISEADFQRLPLGGGVDLAFAIESFVHAIEPERFVAEAARILRPQAGSGPGGRLVLIDDFLGQASDGQEWLELYRRGWQVNNLIRPAELVDLAAGQGLRLVENRLLSPFLRLRALPDLPARGLRLVASPFWGVHPIVPSMLGSMALQKCLLAGSVEYRCLVFEWGA